MITAKRLKELLKQIPDNAKCYAYEGEDVGIGFYIGEDVWTCKKYWWIAAGDSDVEDTRVTGFEEQPK